MTYNKQKVMEKRLLYLLLMWAIAFGLPSVQAQEISGKVVSQGGGVSQGGEYTNFTVIGGEPVDRNVTGKSYFTQIGFLYSRFSTEQNTYDSSALLNAPKWTYASSFGGDSTTSITSIEVDNDKNVLLYGQMNGSFDFFGEPIIDADSGSFLAKLDPSYNLIWLKKINRGHTKGNIGDYLVYDKISGANYIAGTFFDEILIDNMRLVSANPGVENHYIAKIDAQGIPQWIKEFPLGVNIDDLSAFNNELIVSGTYSLPVTLEGVSLVHLGDLDLFLAKYNGDGLNTFVKTISGVSAEYMLITTLDGQGNIYATSEATSSVIEYENRDTLTIAEGAGNVLMVKYDPSGTRLWANIYGGSNNSSGDYSVWPTAITSDPSGNPIIMGWFGTKNGFGSDTLESKYTYNKYITKILPTGEVSWAKSILEEQYGFNYNEMETDELGNIYFMSQQKGTIYIEGKPYYNEGPNDKYIVKYLPDGRVNWIQRAFTTTNTSWVSGMGVAEEDYLYVGGYFNDPLLSLGNFELSSTVSHGFLGALGTQSNIKDSLALVEFYEATNGAQWSDNGNWLTGNLDQWTGVYLNENGRVKKLSLPDNSLDGFIPNSINNLTAIDTIEVQGNKISHVPDMTVLRNLIRLDISRNRLEFGSLEPNASMSGINYQDQDSIGIYAYSEIAVGSNFQIKIKTSGEGNNYQWYFNGQVITGATDSTYSISNIDRSSMGDYHVEVTNGIVPGLTLIGRNNKINATASISGQINLSTGTPLPLGDVKLLHIVENGYDTLHIVEVDQQGAYLIENVILYDYLFVATADTSIYPDEFPTYYSRAIFWEEADTLKVTGNLQNLDIDLEAIESLDLQGPGAIFATLNGEEPDESGRITKVGDRVAGAGVSVRRKVRTGRKNPYPNSRIMEDYELVDFLYTNENGEVTFRNLEPDTYRINFQYPGFPMDEASNQDIVIGSKKTGDEERTITAVVTNGKIKVEQNTVVGVADDLLLPEVRVYPNPVQSYLNVTAPTDGFDPYELVIWDSKGSLMNVNRKLNGDTMVLDLQSLPKGIYILNLIDIKSNGIVKSYKVILSE